LAEPCEAHVDLDSFADEGPALLRPLPRAGRAAPAQGAAAALWIGTGSNQSVSPDQVKDALGQQQVEQIANEAGVSTDEAAAGLSRVLPDAVDNVTPSGQVPSAGDVRAQFGS
jgi:uncharacterized protein YidB (DUF937 family)